MLTATLDGNARSLSRHPAHWPIRRALIHIRGVRSPDSACLCAMRQRGGATAAVALVALTLLLARASALRFYLKQGESRCFTFDAEADSLQRGDASVTAAGANLEVRITATGGDPRAKPVYAGRLTGASKFSFRTPVHAPHLHSNNHYDDEDDEDDEDDVGAPRAAYSACLTLVRADRVVPVSFSIRPAHPDVDPSDVAASDKGVKSVSIAMRQMHETLTQLTRDLSRLQQRERKLLDRNARVGKRIVSLAFFALIILVGSTAIQLAYFKSFFKQKKLL